MSVDRDNVIQAFGWFKDLMDADIDAKLAGLSYTLPAATEYDLGGVKVGDGLGMDADDRLNVTISGGESNVIEAITVDGTIQPVTNKTAALNLSAFAKKTDVANALSSISSLSLAINSLKVGDTNVIEAIKVDGTTVQPDANKTVNLNLSATYAKKTEVASGVRMKGSVDFFSDLANLSEVPAVGDLYNIKTAGGTDGDGTPILAGDNVVYTDKGTWDVMAGFVDTSRFVEKVAGKQLSSNDFTNADKAKLDSLSSVTQYTLPAATTTERGGIRPGVGLEMRTLSGGKATDILDCTLFIGATSTTPGIAGMVPAPSAGQQEEFLCCDGNWTSFPTASTTAKGGVIIGAGLSMSGDTLNCIVDSGDTYDDFTGATSIVGGASGLVPAPLAGANAKFLCGNGRWEDVGKYVSVVNTGGSTGVVVGTDQTAVQGALWMDYTSDGTAVLKLRNGDYEYNYIPDSSNYAGSALPTLDTSNKGQIYHLGTTPATANGGLWYEMEGDTPKLGLHYGKNLIFDFFYHPDSTTYKGGTENLVCYIPCNTVPVFDALNNGCMYDRSTQPRSLVHNTALPGGTGVTTSERSNTNYIELSPLTADWALDFWFTLLPSATSVTTTQMMTSAFIGSRDFGIYKESNVFQLNFYSNYFPLNQFINTAHHVAYIRKNKIRYIALDGHIYLSASDTTNAKVQIFPTAYTVINKIRMFNKAIWDGTIDLDPPTMDDYI